MGICAKLGTTVVIRYLCGGSRIVVVDCPSSTAAMCSFFCAPGLNPHTKLAQLENDMPRIKNYLELNVLAKAQQLRRLSEHINFKIKINSWEGMRHQHCLTVNGQKKGNGNTQRRLGERRARYLNFPLAKPKATKQFRVKEAAAEK
jgi:ribosomal protein S13